MLFVAVMLLVTGFKSSSNLAAAYGIAVTLAMAIDSLLIFVVLTRLWRWNPLAAPRDRRAAGHDRPGLPRRRTR